MCLVGALGANSNFISKQNKYLMLLLFISNQLSRWKYLFYQKFIISVCFCEWWEETRETNENLFLNFHQQRKKRTNEPNLNKKNQKLMNFVVYLIKPSNKTIHRKKNRIQSKIVFFSISNLRQMTIVWTIKKQTNDKNEKRKIQ